MSRIGLVAWHVFKESVRDRVLYGLAGFAVLLFAASVLIGEITAGQDVKIIKDLGLAAIELVGVLMSVVVGVGLVAREIERRSIHGLLAKPVARWEFVVGKYLGLLLTLAVNVLLMTAVFFLMLAWMHGATPEATRLGWDVPAVDPALLKAVVLIGAELALLTAVALFFSTFSSSALLSIAFTLGVFVAGLYTADLLALARVVESQVARGVLWTLGTVLPSFAAFDVKGAVVHGRPPVTLSYLSTTLAYGALYSGALLVAAVTVFSRREFK